MLDAIKGKVILLIGASSGIGRATALMAARSGGIVIAAARRKEQLQTMQAALEREGIHIAIQQTDATSLDDIATLVNSTLSQYGRIDIAVYATGTNTPDRAMKVMSPSTWSNILDTNLSGAFYLSHALLPAMRKAGAGHIIFVSSTAGTMADLSGAAYQASKRGLLGLAHAIRLEERAAGIRTCCIMPGLTNTELVEKRPEKVAPEILKQALQPEDVAAMIHYVMQLPPRVTVPELLMVPSSA